MEYLLPTRITLRGNRSLTGNNQALIIVDGAIYYNDISNLNPDDIESINCFKRFKRCGYLRIRCIKWGVGDHYKKRKFRAGP